MDKPIVLFDGVCNLCAWSVRFIIDRNPQANFRFASLQSPAGQLLRARYGPPTVAMESVVLIEQGQWYIESDAALRITRFLSSPWSIFYIGLWIPRPIRDVVYRWVARHRYHWFGKSETCLVPWPELRERFLDE